MIVFSRETSENYPAAGLTLWGTWDGYYVSNIVPAEISNLTYAQYNAILADFVDRIAGPAAPRFGFTVTRTEPRQSIEDWSSPDAALKLRRFSGGANKSTGSSHPADERRWFDFIIAAHRARGKLDASRLARWLHEIEGWGEDSAHDLAGEFEKSLALLQFYDEN